MPCVGVYLTGSLSAAITSRKAWNLWYPRASSCLVSLLVKRLPSSQLLYSCWYSFVLDIKSQRSLLSVPSFFASSRGLACSLSCCNHTARAARDQRFNASPPACGQKESRHGYQRATSSPQAQKGRFSCKSSVQKVPRLHIMQRARASLGARPTPQAAPVA